MAWYQTTNDNFTRANQTGLGNGWTIAGSGWSIASNQAVIANISSPWSNAIAVRPTSENSLNSRIVVTLPPPTTGGGSYYSYHRYQSAGTGYACGLDTNGGIEIFNITGGALTQISVNQGLSPAYNSAHTYSCDSSVTGTSPTTLTVTVTDVTTSTVVATKTVTDSTAGLQTIGQTGLFSYLPSATSLAYSSFTNYTDVASAGATTYTFTGATTGVISTPTTYTNTISGSIAANVTVTPSDSSGGGTFSPTSLTFAPNGAAAPASQTFTYTPASVGTKTLSTTNSSTLTNPASIALVVAAAPITIPVTSTAFLFSPGNWKGDTVRAGSLYRASWNIGAYVTFTFTASSTPTAKFSLTANASSGLIVVMYVNGIYVDEVAATGDITIPNLVASTTNVVKLILKRSPQTARWSSGVNSIQIKGVALDSGSTAGVTSANSQWALIVGDSITEGILANNGSDSTTQDYSFALGRFLETQGMDYCVNACGGSGWIRPGDTGGDVPALYAVSGSTSGVGGTYTDASSRWNKVDQGVSLLSSDSLLSSYGATATSPSVIFINLMTNEALTASSVSDCQASVTQCLAAYRTAAPSAVIIVQVPFGMYGSANRAYSQSYMTALKAGVTAANVGAVLVDFGPSVSQTITTLFYTNADYLHPNVLGHQYIATLVNGAVANAITPTIAQIATAVWARSQRTVTA